MNSAIELYSYRPLQPQKNIDFQGFRLDRTEANLPLCWFSSNLNRAQVIENTCNVATPAGAPEPLNNGAFEYSVLVNFTSGGVR